MSASFLKKKLHSINYKMIENGWALIYKRYSFPKNYLIAEDYAKKTNSGIWQENLFYQKYGG